MAAGDIVQTPQIVGELSTPRVNQELRKIWQRLNAQEGRTDSSQVRDDMEVLGEVSAGSLVATSADLGSGALAGESAGIDPTIPADLKPFLTARSDGLGFQIPLEIGGSLFHFSAYDSFISTGTAAGATGVLGWMVGGAGTIAPNTADMGHPGILLLDTGPTTTPERISLTSLFPTDIVYLGGVIRVERIVNSDVRLGLMLGNLAGTGEVRQGMYFSFLSGSSPNWRTVTRDASGITVNTSTVPVGLNEWVVLEMVLAPTTIDFFINRQRVFRHTTNILASAAAPAFVVESTDAVASSASIDTFLMLGTVPNAQLWT